MTAAQSDTKPANTGKVLTLSNEAVKEAAPPKRRRAPSKLALSFVLCVVLPFMLAAIYYTTIATDRYAARAGFSIRGIDTNAGIDGIGALTGLASTGSTTSDSYVVLSYLEGRDLLEDIDRQLDLRGHFSAAEIDVLSRLPDDATIEDFVAYWGRRIHTQFDPTSGIIEFEVQSFDAAQAEEIAKTALNLTQTFVNELSANAREDSLQFARREVAFREDRLRAALTQIREFRASEQSVDPAASAALEVELIAGLEARLIDLNARIAVLRQSLDDTAPTLIALQRDAQALTAQIVDRREAIGRDVLDRAGASDVTEQLARYEELEVERHLAQQAYASALASLEQARLDADRQQRYLAIHLQPRLAETALYPRRVRNLFVLGFALVAAWGIGALLTYSVRDHLT
ncbi:MAG: lipopolysaccharide biosynthesis protein [Pseudomonadota bacterium]